VAWPDRDTDACPCHRWIIMAAVRSRCRHYIFALWFISSFFYLFSSPNLSCRRLDLYHTSTHDVHGLSVNLECMSEMCCTRIAENTGRRTQKLRQNSPSVHHCTICRAISSQLRRVSTIGKNLLNGNISSICCYNMVNFGPLTSEIFWRVWGTPANFNGFRVLVVLLNGTLPVGVSQTLRR